MSAHTIAPHRAFSGEWRGFLWEREPKGGKTAGIVTPKIIFDFLLQ
jgi:hypothetical protein